ncbi:MAG: A24 family peptidase [Lachnospiraceae bacterium]|nr:A24 family peptidase [Lachnospiraceae bacterium]
MNYIFEMLFLIHLLMIAEKDIHEKKIPNRYILSLCLVAAGFIAVCRTSGIAAHFLGAVCVSAVLFLIALIVPGAFGMGDVKLMAAGGWFLGWKLIILSGIFAFLISGLYIIVVWFLQAVCKKGKTIHRRTELAFGVFLCIGMAVSLLWGEQVINCYVNSPFY